MTKQEILDAINATIVANGQKGITAESLANILVEMVNAVGESGSGSGSGSEVIKISNMEFTVDTIILSTTDEDAAHNAPVYAKYISSLNGNAPMNISLDISKVFGENEEDRMIIIPDGVMYSPQNGLSIAAVMDGLSIVAGVAADGTVQCLIPMT